GSLLHPFQSSMAQPAIERGLRTTGAAGAPRHHVFGARRARGGGQEGPRRFSTMARRPSGAQPAARNPREDPGANARALRDDSGGAQGSPPLAAGSVRSLKGVIMKARSYPFRLIDHGRQGPLADPA